MKTEIKPCPFCGSVVVIKPYSSDRSIHAHKIECYTCDIKQIQNTKEETLTAWNTRKVNEELELEIYKEALLMGGNINRKLHTEIEKLKAENKFLFNQASQKHGSEWLSAALKAEF